MNNENTRNTVLFIVCAAVIMIFYQIFVLGPAAERERPAQDQAAAAAQSADNSITPPPGGIFSDRRTALDAAGARVPIQTPGLQGSLSLRGARIDDLFLIRYRETLDADSPPVELFRPQGAEYAYFAQFGWAGQNIPGMPGPNTEWRLVEGETLTPATPITLVHDNGSGLRFTRVVSVDEQYMFTIADTVANLGTAPVTLAPYGSVQRQGVPADLGRQFILHEGAIGILDERLRREKYQDWAKKQRETFESTGGWLGITDKYWMAALIPDQAASIDAEFRAREVGGLAVREANMMGAAQTIAPGREITQTQHLFAGAKRAEILRGYERDLGVARFDQAIDWGMFWFLTRPIFLTVEFFYGLVGNFGVAILLLTVVIKVLLFPLANKAYESLSKMKTLQPKMEEIKKKHGSDPQAQQKAMMALYQTEKINPLAGCLPILVQIPVFYALYKVLFVTIEMRHAPFFGWIQDLSARDPSNIWNLFGLLPWEPLNTPLIGGLIGVDPTVPMGGFTLALGILPIFYGLTMWLQMAMNPPAPDPVQRKIFAFMPFVFTFIMAPFAAGLLIYWAWNNILSIAQQYFIMHRFKAENPIDTFIDRYIKKKPAA